MKLPNLFEANGHREEVTHENVVLHDIVPQLKAWTVAMDAYKNTRDVAKLNEAMDVSRQMQRVALMLTQRVGMLKQEHRSKNMARKVRILDRLNADVGKIQAALEAKELFDEQQRAKHLLRLEKAKAWQQRIQARIRKREQWAKDHPTRKMVFDSRQADGSAPSAQ